MYREYLTEGEKTSFFYLQGSRPKFLLIVKKRNQQCSLLFELFYAMLFVFNVNISHCKKNPNSLVMGRAVLYLLYKNLEQRFHSLWFNGLTCHAVELEYKFTQIFKTYFSCSLFPPISRYDDFMWQTFFKMTSVSVGRGRERREPPVHVCSLRLHPHLRVPPDQPGNPRHQVENLFSLCIF